MPALNATFKHTSTSRVTTRRLVTGQLAMATMNPSAARLYAAARSLPHPVATQSELARALGQSPQTVKNWEARGVSAVGASKAQQALGISSTWILEGAEPMFVNGAPVQSHPAGLQRQIIATTVRLIDYVDDMVLDPIPDADRDRLIDIATAEVMERWSRGMEGDRDLAAAGKSVIAKFRTGG